MEIKVCANAVPCLVGTIIPQSVVPPGGKGWVSSMASSQSWYMAGIQKVLRLPHAWKQSVFDFGHREQWTQGKARISPGCSTSSLDILRCATPLPGPQFPSERLTGPF